MKQILNESWCLSQPQHIDRESGVIHGVKIIGNRSRNGRYYPNEVLHDALPLYEGAKVNLDHPETASTRRRYAERFGMIKNVELREDEGLYADFMFNAKHPLAEQLLWDAEHSPENVGFSHNVEAKVRRSGDDVTIEKITAVRSVDLVADPATTAGLFEDAADNAVTKNSLTEERVIELIREHLRVIEPQPVCREREHESGFDVKHYAETLKK